MSTGGVTWTIPRVEPTGDPTQFRMVNLCDDGCHHPVHAFGRPQRMRHLIEADLVALATKYNAWDDVP